MNTVCYVSATGAISGAECSLLAMLDALDRHAWRPLVALPDGPLREELARRGIATALAPLTPLRRPRSLREGWATLRALRRGRRALAEIVRRERPRLLHANTTSAMCYLPSRTPAIWQVRDLTPLGLLGRLLYQRAARVAVISSAVRAALLPLAGDGEGKLIMLPPAVDTARFHPAVDPSALRARFGLPADRPLIGLVAQFVPWKRHHLFLDALERIADRRWCAVLAGADLHRTSDYQATLRARLAGPPFAGRVHWLPWQQDIVPLLAALDLCVLTSANEPFGRVLIEAMACAVATVAVDEGGVRDIVQPEVTGLLAPADAAFLAAALARLLDDPTRRAACGQSGRARAETCFGYDRQREALTVLYSDLLTQLGTCR